MNVLVKQDATIFSWQRIFSTLSFLFWGGNWLLVVILLELALGRLLFYDRTEIFTWVNMMTPYVYLPAYAILLLAAIRRRWKLVIGSGLVILFHLVWTAPLFARAAPLPPSPATTIRLFNANLFFINEQTDPLIAEIRAADPDIILLQEYTMAWHEAFVASTLLDDYPYSIFQTRETPFGLAIWSKIPLQDEEIWEITGIPMSRATILLDGQPVRLYNMHPPPPIKALKSWQQMMTILTETLASETGALIAIGDFNVTPQNYWYREITNGRLRSAHRDIGREWAVTWPNGFNSAPPMRLDHAFLSPEIVCLDIQEGQGVGSDHKPLIVDVALNPTAITAK